MLIILEKLSMLYIFLILGFFFGKWKKEQNNHSGILSFLLVNLFLPAKVFNTFSKNFTVSYITQNSTTIIVSVSLLFVLVGFSLFVAKLLTKDKYEQKVYRYSLTLANYAYMGYALAEGLFGQSGLLNLMMFVPPTTVYIYGYAYSRLTHIQGSAFKRIFNISIIAMLVGAVVGLSGIQLPAVVTTVTAKASGCLAPISMMLAGITISEFDLKSLLTDKVAYALAGLRLAVLPGLVLLLGHLVRLDPVLIRTAVLFFAMPCGLNPIVFSKQVGEDSRPGARYAFVSNVLSLLTLPIFVSLI